MRIVAGKWGGRPITAPAGATTRPTSEKVREAIFNILEVMVARSGRAEGWAGSRVLDLCAGSGGLGLEALSRGAAHVTFVDAGRPALATARANATRLDALAACAFVASDACDFLRPTPAHAWDVVFADPPYHGPIAAQIAATVRPDHLAPTAIVVIEHNAKFAPAEQAGCLRRADTRRYGDTHVSFYRQEPTP